MDNKDIGNKIINFVSLKKEAKIGDLVSLTGTSRAYLNRVLNGLIDEKRILRLGQTNQTRYVIFDENKLQKFNLKWSKHLVNKSLNEDEVFKNLKYGSDFLNGLTVEVVNILEYAFTEMLNNAIDHSGSQEIVVEFAKQNDVIEFMVNDFGVGIFNNIIKKRGLKNEHEAIQDLLKGKQTTAREFHSGEGIFFTSKIADKFSLISERTELIIDNNIGDFFIKKHRRRQGTTVRFEIRANTSKKLSDVFRHFAPLEEGFNKTEIKVRLYALDTSFISRSQARRLLAGLNDFKEVLLDFEKVETIGQGFADEIFRVWQTAHPKKRITYANANENVEFMIKRALY